MTGKRQASVDACPGVFAAHRARDGLLARVRLPGGAVGSTALRVLADCAEELADGVLQLTSRANVQLRGLSAESELIARLSAAGLLPAPAHERVRNFLASPGSGLFGGLVDVRGMVAELDRAVCARAELAALPGRFLFALDDGRGDLADDRADVCWQALEAGPRARGALLLGGADTGVRVAAPDAVDCLVRCASAFVEWRRSGETEAWRLAELGPLRERLVDAAAAGRVLRRRVHPDRHGDPGELGAEIRSARLGDAGIPAGVHGQWDGRYALCVAPVLGALSTQQARLIAQAAHAAHAAVVTPWRTVLIPDIPADEVGATTTLFADAGLAVAGTEPWLGVSACAGSGGCAKAYADVRDDAVRTMTSSRAGTRVHFSGCERRCGRPNGPHIDVLATPEGYRVDGMPVDEGALAGSLQETTPKGTV